MHGLLYMYIVHVHVHVHCTCIISSFSYNNNVPFLQFFLELQHYILTSSIVGESTSQAESDTPDLSTSNAHKSRVKSIQILRQQDEEYASLLGTVFDSVIEAFTSLVRDMENSLIQFIVNSVKSKCYCFKQEK